MKIESISAGPARKAFDERGTVIVGMSLDNSYFSKSTIEELMQTAASSFGDIRVLVADVPAAHNYLAIGYSEEKARKKARLKANTLQNHAMHAKRLLNTEGNHAEVKLIEWAEEVAPSAHYKAELARMQELYRCNAQFRADAQTATHCVLRSRLPQDRDVKEAIDEGVKYLIEELSFLTASPKIYHVENIAYAYHRQWPIFDQLVTGKYDGIKREQIGSIIIR